MALSLIKFKIFEHCLITQTLKISKLFPQWGLFTRCCSAMEDVFVAFLKLFFVCIFILKVYNNIIHEHYTILASSNSVNLNRKHKELLLDEIEFTNDDEEYEVWTTSEPYHIDNDDVCYNIAEQVIPGDIDGFELGLLRNYTTVRFKYNFFFNRYLALNMCNVF